MIKRPSFGDQMTSLEDRNLKILDFGNKITLKMISNRNMWFNIVKL